MTFLWSFSTSLLLILNFTLIFATFTTLFFLSPATNPTNFTDYLYCHEILFPPKMEIPPIIKISPKMAIMKMSALLPPWDGRPCVHLHCACNLICCTSKLNCGRFAFVFNAMSFSDECPMIISLHHTMTTHNLVSFLHLGCVLI